MSSIGNTFRLSIVIPIYNEEKTLREISARVFQSCGEFSQVIFVDDGSQDSSLQIIRSVARPQDIVISKENGGKGSAVRMGYAQATGTYVIVQDADLEYRPEEIPELLALAEKQDAPAVFGSRRLKQQKQYAHFLFFVGGSMLTYLANCLYGIRLTDQPTCYKMVRRDVLATLPLTQNDFRFDPEITAMLARRSIPIIEHPISYQPRTVHEGKKINMGDWFKWVWVFFKLRLLPRSAFTKKN